jgi:hypothetical protein
MTAIFPAVFVFILIMWFLNLRFYYRNGWDFSKDSGLGKMDWGRFGTSGRVPNRVAILLGFPVALVSFGYLSINVFSKFFGN